MTAHSQLYIKLIANNLRRQLRLPCPDEAAIRDMYNSDCPMPIVMTNAHGTVWLDRYYAAFKLPGQEVRYVYISKAHIREELSSCREVRKTRGAGFCLPPDICRQFRKALISMRKTGGDAWVETEDYSRLI